MAFVESVKAAFAEDQAILTAVQVGMDRQTTPNINLRSDTGGVRFRCRLSHMIEAERVSHPDS
ncbi:MAG: hypothetical protein ABIO83_10605 [Ilumatobacteraceae bacterium]